MKLRNWKIGSRIYTIVVTFTICIVALIAVLYGFIHSLEQDAGGFIEQEKMDDQKDKVMVATLSMAYILGKVIEDKQTPEQRVAAMTNAIRDFRYEPDKSGYFFVGQQTKVMVHPTIPSGKDMAGTKDPNGVNLFEDLVAAAEAGGDFVHYSWQKGDEGVLPKISYSVFIPGTDYWIGTGIYVDNVKKEKDRVVAIMEKKAKREFFVVILLTILVIAVVIIPTVFFIIKSITKPVKEIAKLADQLATGDTDVTIEVIGKDEVSQMEHSFVQLVASISAKSEVAEVIANNDLTHDVELVSEKDSLGRSLQRMQESLRSLIKQIKDSSMEIDTGAENLSSLGDSLSNSSSQQAASVEEISSSMDEVNSTIQGSAQEASSADELAQKQMTDVKQGVSSMKELELAIAEITESNSEIVKIVSVIDNISFQTNLLALNAAVEAARAGQHGKGFAVVADEVRTLANRSAKAAKEVAELVKRASDKVERGTEATASTAEILQTIGEGAESVASTLQGIKKSAEQQAVSIQEINSGMGQITDTTQDNAASAEETAAAAQDLSHQAMLLRDVVSSFEV